MKYKFIQFDRAQERNAAIAREIVYQKVFKELPKRCGCRRVYRSEIEYTNRTRRASNALCESGYLLFMRNCACKSTLDVTLNMHKWPRRQREIVEAYITTLGMQAERNFRAQYKTGAAWKYIHSTAELVASSATNPQPQKVDVMVLLSEMKKPAERKYFWDNVGINILRDIHNDDVRVREKKLESRHRVLVVNGKDRSLRDLFIPDTKIAYRHGLREGMHGLNENPEGTSAIILDMRDKAQEDEYIGWVRKHDEKNEGNRPGFIKEYHEGIIIPIFRFGEKLHSEGKIITLVKPCSDLITLVQSSFKK